MVEVHEDFEGWEHFGSFKLPKDEGKLPKDEGDYAPAPACKKHFQNAGIAVTSLARHFAGPLLRAHLTTPSHLAGGVLDTTPFDLAKLEPAPLANWGQPGKSGQPALSPPHRKIAAHAGLNLTPRLLLSPA